MTCRLKIALFTMNVLCWQLPVHSGTIYTTFVESVTNRTTFLATIDANNGNVTIIGTTGVTLEGLAYDSSNDVLYASGLPTSNGSGINSLYRVNRFDGSVTVVGSTNFASVTGLAYDSSSDVLYAGVGNPGVLAIIDRTSGAASPVGTASLGVSSLEYFPPTDKLVFTNFPDQYGELDRLTGDFVINGHTAVGAIFGMGYDADVSVLYAVAGDARNQLFEFDPAAGTFTSISSLPVHFYASMAVIPIPEPSTFVLWVGAVTPYAYSWRRRRRQK